MRHSRLSPAFVAASLLLTGHLDAAQLDLTEQGVPEGRAVAAPDSSDLHDAAREEQARFERTRVRNAPMVWGSSGSSCDERIGRMCVRLDEDGPREWDPPSEDPRVIEARGALLDALEEIGRQIPGDGWVLGQRVTYAGESGDWEMARALARACGLAPEDVWWCGALEGTALHYLERFEEAGEAFRSILPDMPEEVRSEWLDLEPILESGLRSTFRDAPADSLEALRDRLWALADPLFLVRGRDRETEHYSRHTLSHARADARNPYAMRWGGDLEEILVRYGPEVLYEQERPTRPVSGPPSVVGHFHPASARYLPLEEHFRSPGSASPGEWSTDDTRAQSRHVPQYAELIGTIEVQQARFRRGDELLVVLGWAAQEFDAEEASGQSDRAPEDVSPAIDAGLFLLSDPGLRLERGTSQIDADGVASPASGPRGVAWAQVPQGTYLVSVEAHDAEARRAWRARHGVTQDSLPRGVAGLSDLLLLDAPEDGVVGRPVDTLGPDALELHLDRVLHGADPQSDLVEVAWEVYGLSTDDETVTFELSAGPEGTGFFRRAGEFLRLVGPQSPVRIDWTETVEREGTSAPQALFRRLVVDLSSLPDEPIRISVSLRLPGRTPVVSEMVIDRGEA